MLLFRKHIFTTVCAAGLLAYAPQVQAMDFMLDHVPAGGLRDTSNELKVGSPATIERLNASNPFPVNPSAGGDVASGSDGDKPLIHPDSGDVLLDVQVKMQDESDEDNLRNAYEAMVAGQHESAVAYLKRIVVDNPESTDALFNLAVAYHKSGQAAQAEQYYNEIIALDQRYWPAVNNLMLLLAEEHPQKAIAKLEELVQSNPEFAPVHAQLGMLYHRLDMGKKAILHLGRASVLDPANLSYRYNLALMMQEQGYYSEARSLYIQLLKKLPYAEDAPVEIDVVKSRIDALEGAVSLGRG